MLCATHVVFREGFGMIEPKVILLVCARRPPALDNPLGAHTSGTGHQHERIKTMFPSRRNTSNNIVEKRTVGAKPILAYSVGRLGLSRATHKLHAQQ
jgi:hypothetical protein